MDALKRAVELDGWFRRTCIGILCETKSLGPSSLSVVHEPKVENLSAGAEDVGDLFFGQA